MNLDAQTREINAARELDYLLDDGVIESLEDGFVVDMDDQAHYASIVAALKAYRVARAEAEATDKGAKK